MPELLNRNLLDNARERMSQYAFDEACQMLEPLANADAVLPESENALFFWHDAAEVMSEAGMCEAAEMAWKNAQKAGMESHAAEVGILYAYVLAGRAGEALSRSTTLAQEFPRNPVIRNLHALALFENGGVKEALAEWESSRRYSSQMDCPLSTQPQYLALGTMGVEGYLFSRREEIKKHYAAGSVDASGLSDSQGKRMHQIQEAWEQGEYLKALAWVDEEISTGGFSSSDAKGLELRMLRALALGGMARWDEARQETAGVLTHTPENPGAKTYLAYALINSGEAKLGLMILDRVPPAGPDDYFANYIRGCGWLELGDRPRAAQAFRTAFSCYFYDSYHSVLVPAWKRMVRMVQAIEQSPDPSSRAPLQGAL